MTIRQISDRDRLSKIAALLASAICFAATQSYAQQAPVPTGAATTTDSMDDEVIELSPFIIEASEDSGYQAKSTLAGTQVRTELRDVGSAISVVTPKFLSDTNSKTAADLLVLTTSTEVSGQGGNFLGGGDGAVVDGRATVTSPVANTRVRGLAEADNVRDFFLTDIPWDSYNVGRVDLQRGANSVLFGIGSPAGIINSSVNTATFKDQNKVEFQVASYGSGRLSADFNKVILKNELAIRVALLGDRTKYRQDPAYRDDNRTFAALTYSPKFLAVNGMKTTFRVNFEKGNVHSNLPRLTPPMDTITPFFLGGTVAADDGVVYNNLNKTTYLSSETDPATTRSNALYNPWVGAAGGRVYDGTLAIFGGPNATAQSGIISTSVWGNYPTNPDTTSQGPTRGYRGIVGYANYLNNVREFGYNISPFKNRSLTDPSVFDFYNNLIEGDNAKQWNKFKAYNLDLTQTFFNNKVGVNLAYDYQRAKWGNTNFVSWDAGAIGVDLMDTFIDGTANPNVGKAYLLAGGGSAGSNNTERIRKTKRAKVFAELDFKDYLDRDSLVTRIIGRHNFTLNATDYEAETQTYSWANWYIGSGYGQTAGNAVGQASRDVIGLTYLSDVDLRGRTSSAGLNLGRLNAMQVPTSATVRNWSTTARDWVTYNLPVVNPNMQAEDVRDYTQRRHYVDNITSQVAVWQGYLFDGNLIPMFGWRKDISKNYDAAFTANGGIISNSNTALLPTTPTNRVEGQTQTFSIVGHVPKFIMKHVPGGINLSAFYNQSENFKPDASRIDIIGNSIAAPSGETKDYGVTISAFDEKVSLKINKYETRVNLATLDGAGIGNVYLIGAGEAWGQAAAVGLTKGTGAGSGDFGRTSTGQVVAWEPQAIDSGPNQTRDWDPSAAGGNGAWVYRQAALDATYAEQIASVNDWLANPIPVSMQQAWKMTDYATGGGSWSQNTVAVTGDTYSEGTEYELAANPLRGLDISINAAKTDASRLNIGKAYSDWIDKRVEDYKGPMGDMRIWGGGNWFYDNRPANAQGTNGADGTVRNKFYNETYPNYLLMKALTNTSVPELRPWRFNVTANYSFQSSLLKGANVGGSYRWQDRQVTGFGLNTAGDGYDVSKRWYGPSDDAVDMWIGYDRKISSKIKWRIQLNVRNLFYTKKLIPVTVQPDGSYGSYRLPEPRVVTLTNSFEF